TPVAPHGADVQQDGLILGARPRERGLAPRVPVHRLVGGGLEVGGGFGGEEVRHLLKSSPRSSGQYGIVTRSRPRTVSARPSRRARPRYPITRCVSPRTQRLRVSPCDTHLVMGYLGLEIGRAHV